MRRLQATGGHASIAKDSWQSGLTVVLGRSYQIVSLSWAGAYPGGNGVSGYQKLFCPDQAKGQTRSMVLLRIQLLSVWLRKSILSRTKSSLCA